MKPCFSLAMALLLCAATNLQAQEKLNVKFGKISPEDFAIKEVFDSGANAVIIADAGTSSFEGNSKGWFSLVHKHFRRLKILSKNGFDAASIKILLYKNGESEEKLESLKASTYNLEGGRIVEAKVEPASVFNDRLDKKHFVKKFTFPAVKEGSIIEYTYTLKSDFLFNLQPWSFQSEYPCLWSEYQVEIPEFFNYVTLNQGYIKLDQKSSSFPSVFKVTVPGGADKDEQVTLKGEVYTRHWLAKSVPAMKEENFTSSLKNYNSGVEFQLSSYQFEGGTLHNIMGTWQLLGEKLMEEELFGSGLSRNNNWLDDDLKNIDAGITARLDKAKKIFAYLRDHVTCTEHSAVYLESTLKDAYKKHSGSVADINLLLVAMLRHKGITADPLILSTKDNGFSNELYPLLDRYNYVVCRAEIDGVLYNLDASSAYNGFDRLPPYCYNGQARVITKGAAMPVYFDADSLREQKLTSVIISNDEKGGMVGAYKSQLGYYESFNLRKKLKGDDKDYIKSFKSGNNFEMTVSDAAVDSLKIPDMPAMVRYDFSFKPASEDNIIYFNPLMSEGMKVNPFSAAERRYPVEMAYTMDETYVLTMEIPEGYKIEELPKSVRVNFNESEGLFEYLIQGSDHNIQLRTRIKLNKASFDPDDYSSLRDFFGFVVKKHGEQIVLKKK